MPEVFIQKYELQISSVYYVCISLHNLFLQSFKQHNFNYLSLKWCEHLQPTWYSICLDSNRSGFICFVSPKLNKHLCIT